MPELNEYTKTVWEDLPSEETPINAENLNKIENQIEAITNDVMASNLLTKIIYKGEVALLTDLPSTNQKIGDYYIVVEKGVPYLWNGTEFKAQVVIPEIPEGGETAQSLGTLISSADAKATPDVDDVFGYSDSEDVVNPNILKKLTWGNIRGSLATFFEGIFALVLHGHSISDVTGLQTSLDSKAPYTSLRPKNWIINGMFDVWQRGTTQTSSGYGSDDRFNNTHSGSTKTHSRQVFTAGQTDVPNNPTYFSRTVVTSVAGAGNYVFKSQRIEDITKLAGKVITVSFWAKADANKNIAISFEQAFGTGGSSTISGIGIQKFALTSSWQKFTKTITLPSVSGKTIGANNSLHFVLWFDAGSSLNAFTDSLGNQSGTFDIANVSLVEGSVPVECQNQPYADVLRECQRYYHRISRPGSIISAFGKAYSTTICVIYVNLPVTMRTIPSSIEFNSIELLDPNVNSYPITAVSFRGAETSEDLAVLTATVASGLTVNSIYASRVATGYIGLSAEL